MKEKIFLTSEYMTLGQMLKEASIISSGGQAKWFLAENSVFIDGELENRRGRKLYGGMMIEIPSYGTYFIAKQAQNDEVE
jgi:S4 domain protein YaaA